MDPLVEVPVAEVHHHHEEGDELGGDPRRLTEKERVDDAGARIRTVAIQARERLPASDDEHRERDTQPEDEDAPARALLCPLDVAVGEGRGRYHRAEVEVLQRFQRTTAASLVRS